MSASLRRGLHVIAALAEEPATASEVAAMTGVSLSTAVRLLQLLEDENFAERDEGGRYRVGVRLLSTAYRVIAGMDVRQVAMPVLRRLNRETGHPVHLGHFQNSTLIYIDKYEGTTPVQMHSRIGSSTPLHATAMGKAVAAHLSPDEQHRLATNLDYPRFTAHTISSAQDFLQELATVRERGHAFNFGEHENVISAIAVPLVRPDSGVEHGIDLAVPNFLVSDNELRKLAPRVVEAAHDIEERLGYRHE